MVAKSLERYYLGCELHEDYGKLIQNRLGERKGSLDEFLWGNWH